MNIASPEGPIADVALSVNGEALYYSRKVSVAGGEERYHIYRQDISSGTTRDLTPDASWDNTQPAVSENLIVFRSEVDGGGLYTMDLDGRNLRLLTKYGNGPTLSGDGKLVAFVDERVDDPLHRQTTSRLYTMKVATGQVRLIFDGDAVQPRFAPHASRIAFWGVENGKRNIFTVGLDGEPPVPVTNDGAENWAPSWSSDGNRLLWLSDRADTQQIWQGRVGEASGRLIGKIEPVITSAAGVLEIAASKSYLAYVQRTNLMSMQRVLLAVQGDGPQGPSIEIGRDLQTPDVSTDNLWVAVSVEGREENIKLFSGVNGQEIQQLTHNHARNRGPRISSDGKWVAYYSNAAGKYDIYRMDVNGSDVTKLTDIDGSNAGYPVWSPDGRKLAIFVMSDNGAILDLHDRIVRRLPSLPRENMKFVPFSWSSDGTRLAGYALRTDGTGGGIWVLDLSRGRYQSVAPTGWMPVWLKGQQRLVYEDGDDRLMSVDTRTLARHQIVRIAAPFRLAGEFAVSPDDRWLWFGVDREDTRLFLISQGQSNDHKKAPW
jgi:Tol biopolymer transport system component